MSRFTEEFARIGAPALVDWFADAIRYYDSTAVGHLPIDAILTRESQERRKDAFGGWSVVTIRTARFISDDIPESWRPLRIDGRVKVDDKNYSIERIDAIEGGMTLLSLKRVEAGEVTRPGYRGRA